MRKGYKHYGLQGGTIKISKKKRMESAIRENQDAVDPWSYGQQRAKVIAETPCFIVVTILSHYNPHGFDISSPYNTSVHKHDILTGEVTIRDLDDNIIR